MKEIMVKIKGIQVSPESEQEAMELVTEAKLYSRGDAVFLIYDESELSGMPGCKTRLKLKNKEVHLKRFGEGPGIGNEIHFEEGKRYNGFYDTPFGALELEVLTNKIDNTLSEDGSGAVDIDYDISLKGLIEGRKKLSITVM